jgi:autotransporter-associated beta strand protein/T5SS/PEP-CTERM-associated repeat protein
MMLVARMSRVVFSIGVVAYLLGGAPSARAQSTTTYGSGGSSNTFTGGTISPGDTVLLNDGASVTGAVTANGTLQFNQSAGNTLTISNLISGTGTLSLTNTGTLNLTGTSGAANTIVLDMTTSASSGVLQMNAASGNLWVGGSGTGTLNMTGGRVSNSTGLLGFSAGSVGTATVSSGTWATSGDLTVGRNGTGTLIVTGGYVSNVNGFIAASTGSVGTATVSTGTWANSGNLTVGGASRGGTGTLTMNGGLVIVGGTLSKNAASTINLNTGGTLQIGVGGVSGVLGVSTLTNNGTLIFNRSGTSTYSGVLSGSGTVTKQAAGLLTFAGANSYSGLTTISAGTLALSGTGSIGTGGVNLGTTGSPGVFDLLGLTASSYSLPATGNLAGVGALSGNGKSLAVLGSFLPGNSPGTVTLGSGFTLDLSSSGSSVFEITSPAYTAGTYDLVSGDGSVVFGGILNLAFSGGSYANGTDVLQLFANTGGRSGNFSAVNATGLEAGQSATFNPATGFITVVPEPSTCASLLAGLAYGGSVVFRRRRAH